MIRPIVAARIVNTALGFERIVYALLDTGGDRDVISPSIVAELRLETWTEVLTVQTLDYLVSGERSLTAMTVESIDGKYSAMVKGALVGRLLAGNSDVPLSKRNLSHFPHLAALPFEDHDANLDLIIGVPHVETWSGKELRRQRY